MKIEISQLHALVKIAEALGPAQKQDGRLASSRMLHFIYDGGLFLRVIRTAQRRVAVNAYPVVEPGEPWAAKLELWRWSVSIPHIDGGRRSVNFLAQQCLEVARGRQHLRYPASPLMGVLIPYSCQWQETGRVPLVLFRQALAHVGGSDVTNSENARNYSVIRAGGIYLARRRSLGLRATGPALNTEIALRAEDATYVARWLQRLESRLQLPQEVLLAIGRSGLDEWLRIDTQDGLHAVYAPLASAVASSWSPFPFDSPVMFRARVRREVLCRTTILGKSSADRRIVADVARDDGGHWSLRALDGLDERTASGGPLALHQAWGAPDFESAKFTVLGSDLERGLALLRDRWIEIDYRPQIARLVLAATPDPDSTQPLTAHVVLPVRIIDDLSASSGVGAS